MRMITFPLAVLALVFPLLLSSPVQASDLPRIMLAGEDVDRDSVPRGSRPFKRVMNALVTGLQAEGFNDVYDETATSGAPDHGKRRNLENLIDVGRDAGADVLVIFTIYWNVDNSSYAPKVEGRIEGRLLNIQDGRRLGNFEKASKRGVKVKQSCNRECQIEAVGDLSKKLASTVAEVLRQKLGDYVGGSSGDGSGGGDMGPVAQFVIIMEGFNQDERDSMEEILEDLPGYKSLRPRTNDDNGPRYQSYWYKTELRSAKLQRNLRKAMKKIKVRGIADFSGNEINLTKTGRIKKTWKKKTSEWD